MAGAESRRERQRDAEATRAAILDAAEEVFAEHGFHGARVDDIATRSGYNKSLIFQYFGDKLGLYTEVLRRAQRETNELRARAFSAWLKDEAIATDACHLRALIEASVRNAFDYLLERPHVHRILLWEMADGWQTLAKISSQFPKEHIEWFQALFQRAQEIGLVRSSFLPLVQLSVPLQICQSYIAYLPWFQLILPGVDLSSPAALERARGFCADLVVAGVMADRSKTT